LALKLIAVVDFQKWGNVCSGCSHSVPASFVVPIRARCTNP